MAEQEPIREQPTLAETLELLRVAIEADYPGFSPRSITIKSGADWPDICLPIIPHRVALPSQLTGNRPLSDTESRVLNALGGGGWLTGQQLADACRLPRSTYFMGLLSNLAEAGVIESSTRHGYRILARPPG